MSLVFFYADSLCRFGKGLPDILSFSLLAVNHPESQEILDCGAFVAISVVAEGMAFGSRGLLGDRRRGDIMGSVLPRGRVG